MPPPPSGNNVSLTGEDLGAPCAGIAELTQAFTATFGGQVELGEGLRSVRCHGDYATAWTSPDPADERQLEPVTVIFHRESGGWKALGNGTAGTCAIAKVPDDDQDHLDCY